jgi:hypothetical protein
MTQIQQEAVKTKLIKKALEKYIAKNLIPPSEVDFTLSGVETYIKSRKSDSFELCSKELLQNYLDKEKILDEHIEFTQRYTIKIFHAPKKEIELLYDIEYDHFMTHPKLILSPESKIPHKEYKAVDLLTLLYKEFNKIKAEHNILVKIFDEGMKKALKTLVKYIYAKKFTKKVKIPLFEGITPVIARDAELIFWFQEKEHQESMITKVDADELLVEYKKPIYGKNGLNAFGEYIDAQSAARKDDLKAEIDTKSIYIEEDEYTKKYKAKHQGYVYYDTKILTVDTKLRLNEVSRNKNILDSSEEHNSIELIIEQQDVTKDSIKEGVELASQNIQVDGFVGAKSLLEATNLVINGATHQDSKQFAKYATINRHKGTLRAHEANIKLLEGGTVHATKVTIENSLSGSVYGVDVVIKQVKSNLKIYATNSITIALVSGEDNLFEINYKKVPIILSKIEYLKEEIEELREKKRRAEHFDEERAKEYTKMIQEKKEEIEAIHHSYKDARIEIKNPLRGLNYICFSIDDKHKLEYKTTQQKYSPFHLEIKDDLIILQPPAISLSLAQE